MYLVTTPNNKRINVPTGLREIFSTRAQRLRAGEGVSQPYTYPKKKKK
jgi:hypothetical protein